MLDNITIKNFRAISELTLDNLGKINLLFGENNCGKSSILEAIFCFAAQNASLPISASIFRKIYKEEKMHISTQNRIKHLFNNLKIENIISLSASSNNINELLDINCEFENSESIDPESEVYLSSHELEPDIKGITLKYQNSNLKNHISASAYIKDNPNRIDYDFLDGRIELNATFVNHITQERIYDKFSEIQKRKDTNKLVSLLSKIDNNINDLRLDDDSQIVVDTKTLPELVPIELMGDGVVKSLRIAIAILSDPDIDIVIIDEIENGLHHKSQDIVWKAIIEWAKEYNIQFFITTHSYEMIERLTRQLDDADKEILKAFRIERKKEEFRVVDLDAESLSYMIGKRWEIR